MPRRRSLPVVVALLLCCAFLFGLSPGPVRAQFGCERWHWYIFSSQGLLRVEPLTESEMADMLDYGDADKVLAMFPTEGAAYASVCRGTTDLYCADGACMDQFGTYMNETYDVSLIYDSDWLCWYDDPLREPDLDGDGVVDDGWDLCPDTPPNTLVDIETGCACVAPSAPTATPRPPAPRPTSTAASGGEITANMGCGPTPFHAEKPVTCEVFVEGAGAGGQVEVHWYLDYEYISSGTTRTFAFTPEEAGPHTVSAFVEGEENTVTLDLDFEVGETEETPDEDLAVDLVVSPDRPTQDQIVMVILVVNPRGLIAGSRWRVDGEVVATDTYVYADSGYALGVHTAEVTVWTTDDREITRVVQFTVTEADAETSDGEAPEDEAALGFAPGAVTCDAASSDEPLSCAATLGRAADFAGRLRCTWQVDGATADTTETTANRCAFSLDRPAPGEHTVRLTVTDVESGASRATSARVVVAEGMGPAPDPWAAPDPDAISGGAQAGAAIGTTGIVGMWLWLEWLRARRNAVDDAQLAAERQQWYEDQMARNDAERAVRAVDDAQQQALEDQWQRLWNGLMEISRHSEGMDHVLDWVERHRDDAWQDGRWDADKLAQLQEGARRLGAAQTDRALYNAKKAFADTVTPAMETVFVMSRSALVRAGTDILTAGTGEIVWTPMSALDTMWTQVSVHHTSADRAASVAYTEAVKNTASNVLWNRVGVGASRVLAPEIEAVKDAAAGAARRWLARRSPGVQRVVQTLTRPIDGPLRDAVDGWRTRGATGPGGPGELPRIRHVPGGPETYLDAPTPMTRRWQQLRDLGLADDVEQVLVRSGGRPDIRSVPALGPGQTVTLTPDEEIARRLLNNPNYRRAVTEGAVPAPVHELVNATRDKLGRQAIHRALEDVRLRRPDLADRIARVEITGTGARPRSAPATRGWTDLDVTVRGVDDGLQSRLAETEFTDAFNTRIREAGVNPQTADARAFSGLRARTSGAGEGAYRSPGMVTWQETDVTYRGRVAFQTESGTTVFDAHPDVRPMEGQGPLVDPVARTRRLVSIDPAAATADARRVVEEHVAQMPESLGHQPDRLTILRSEGKHARRVWWVRHAGSGTDAPPGLRVLDRMKNDRAYVPSDAELDAAWDTFRGILEIGETPLSLRLRRHSPPYRD